MSDIVISVKNVSKCYRIFDDQRSRFLHALSPRHTRGMQEVWALKDINIEVARGESLGVIGRNGSGKSTLLEIVTQTLTPTTGEVQVNGRVAALLELGSGFNPEYTGRENVLLNGLLMGLTREEVEHRFDDIAAFADIGDVLDRQVKTYSSGMLVRLAFAVQVALTPDILIVDEALSVGDYFFQQKCFGHLRKMREDGLTLLFVSHDMGTVRDLCKRAIYLRHGSAEFTGDSGSAIRHYFNEDAPSQPANTVEIPALLSYVPESSDVRFAAIFSDALWSRPQNHPGRLIAVSIQDQNNNKTERTQMGSDIYIKVYYQSLVGDVGTTVALAIKNRFDQVIFVTNARRLGIENCDTEDGRNAVFVFKVTLNIEAGLYSLKIGIHQPTEINKGRELDTTGWFGPFRIDWSYETESAPFLGMFGLPASGEFIASRGEQEFYP
ncbi:ABC transporter ATP-binding protein [Acidovorax radicis]|uniref:ABC transporter ATP-binding protein n=1 Tax=Acidovorax radicis TaxID=758826 RepID=UPI0005532FFD|nr:ABC transporter ATP-binding protein [Acidovorax radicis]